MKITTLSVLLLLAITLSAQTEKGATPLTQNSKPETQYSTRAVVVGISDYQDPAIPDLQFAHRDAEAFAEWLKSPAGGSVSEDNITLLINKKATLGKVAMEIWNLLDKCAAGDQAVIYFSGHGDVETKIMAQPGYWLCWDAPPYAYMSGGCFNVRDLQDIINTLSQTNNVRVLVISDACHAGKLAGSEAGGTQITAANFARHCTNEVKILSCQPNEFSVEGTQWGEGRGVFSYHLTDALYGLADRNGDALLNLLEVENYLEDRVPAETAPHPQLPFVVGDKMTQLARVDARLLEQAKAGKANRQPQLEMAGQRGLESWLLALGDSSIAALYAAFNTALERGELLAPAGRSADDYYRQLIARAEVAPLHGLMTRNFAAALVDESQQVTNKLLKTDPQIVSDMWSKPFTFDHVPGYIGRAIELLGEQHFMYKHLKTKMLFFEAKTLRKENFPNLMRDSLPGMAVNKLENALHFDSLAAYVYAELGVMQFYRFSNFDAALAYAKKALAISPNWAYAHYLAGVCYRGASFSDGVHHLQRAIELDSTFLLSYQELSKLAQRHGATELCLYYRDRYIQKVQALIDSIPETVPVYYRTQLGAELWAAGRLNEAEAVLLIAEKLSKGQDLAVYQYLGVVYIGLEQYEKALVAAEKQIELAPMSSEGYMQAASSYYMLRQHAKVVEFLERVISFKNRPTTYDLYLYLRLGESYEELGRRDAARPAFKKVLELLPDFSDHYEMNTIGRAYLRLDDQAAMQRTIDEGLKRFPNDMWVYYQAGCLYSLAKDEKRALEWLGKAFQNGFTDFDLIVEDTDLDNVRQSTAFKALMKKYFPEQFKD